MLFFNWKSEKTSSRKFVDLIWRQSSKWAVWDPPLRPVRLGDYGTVNKVTGAFDHEGSIYDDPELSKLLEGCKPPSWTPHEEEVLAVASSERRNREAKAAVNADVKVAQVVFEGRWEFSKHSGAVLVAHKPIQSSLPYDLNYEAVAKKLSGKFIVTSVTMCPAYALYLGGKDNSGFTLSLQVEPPVPTSVGSSAGIKWVKEYGGGFYREGNQHEPTYTVLFDLRRCAMRQKKTWLRDSPEPDFEGADKLDVVHAPWGLLDDDGEEEPPYQRGQFKLPALDGDSDSE